MNIQSRPLAKLYSIFIDGGVTPQDSAATARAKRLANVIAISAINNTIVCSLLFWYLKDDFLFRLCWYVNIAYILTYLLSIVGLPNFGRPLNLLSGNLVIFYFASVFRGNSDLELFFFTLSVAPFMYFSWEERKFYWCSLLPVMLFLYGEFIEWNLFEAYLHQYNAKYIRVFSIVAVIHQVIFGFLYFLKQSIRFEAESNENLFKLEIEHRKQMQVQKMSSLGEMAGGISHEINNPLMVIIGKTYHLKRELKKKLPEDEISFQHIEKIETMVHRISKIIRALKNFSRNSDHDTAEIADLNDILELTLDLCRERFTTNGIKLDINVNGEIKLLCRPTEISQVILNLLNNAYDAVQGKQNAWVGIKAHLSHDEVEIKVEDNGEGIPAEIEEKIMQPFFTTKEIGKGTGLGLSISKGLIEGHRGTLNYLRNTGKTSFQIILPANH